MFKKVMAVVLVMLMVVVPPREPAIWGELQKKSEQECELVLKP